MNILLVSQSDLNGGAARATYRLLQGLNRLDAGAKLLVQLKQSADRAVVGDLASSGIAQVRSGLRLTLDHLPLKRYKGWRGNTYSPQWLPKAALPNLPRQIAALQPDIVNLHWVNNGYLPIAALTQIKQPLVWTLHDMWTFTGGCHYAGDCQRYQQTCGQCPELGSQRQQDLSRRLWQRKARAWQSLNLTIVTPSQWLADCARSSSLLRHHRIECLPAGVDTDRYQPYDRTLARQILRLPLDKSLILCGALGATHDRRKGFHLLQPALQELGKAGWADRAEVVIFGANAPEHPPDLGLKVHYLGTLGDDYSLALAYSAADVFVAPSTQENLPNTIVEAIACGTPCVSFKIGGFPDLIHDRQNGYLAQAFDPQDLAQGMAWVLADPERHQKLTQQARQQAERLFTLEAYAQRYLSLFEQILAQPQEVRV